MTQTKVGNEAPPLMKPSYSVDRRGVKFHYYIIILMGNSISYETRFRLQMKRTVNISFLKAIPSRAFSRMEKSSSSVETK